MTSLPHSAYLASSGFVCATIVLMAAVAASVPDPGLVVASVLLAVATIMGGGGVVAARNHRPRHPRAVWMLLVAAVPLFAAFYVLGTFARERIGQAATAGVLFALAVILAGASAALSLRSGSPVRHH